MSEQRSGEQPTKPGGEMPGQTGAKQSDDETRRPAAGARPDESPVRAYTQAKPSTASDATTTPAGAKPEVPASAGGGVGAGGTERPTGQQPPPVGSAQGGAGPTRGPMTERPAMAHGDQPPRTPPVSGETTDRSIAETAHQASARAPGTPAAGAAGSERFGDQVVGDLGWAGSTVRDEASSLPGTPNAAGTSIGPASGSRAGKAMDSARSVASNLPTQQMSGFLSTAEGMIRDKPIVAMLLALFTGYFLGRLTRS